MQQDEDGVNRHNLVYNGSPARPFDGSGNFFLGGENFEHAYDLSHGYNFNRAFAPMITCDACNGRINPPGVAVGALPCACVQDSQCQSVLGSAYKCENQRCVVTGLSYGDVSDDGEISAYDAALCAQATVGLITLTTEQTQRADVSGDAGVSAYDAALIAQCSVGIISKFPVEG